jgi:hypothetical protein
MSLSFVQDDFVPGLELLIVELSVQSQMIHAAMEEAIPFCKQFLLSIGHPVSVSFGSSQDKYSEYSPEFLVQNTSKVRGCVFVRTWIVFLNTHLQRKLYEVCFGPRPMVCLWGNLIIFTLASVYFFPSYLASHLQVVDKVVSRMHAFGVSASKAMEFLHDVDFPSKIYMEHRLLSVTHYI